jgi:hypothetical protein
MTPFVEPVWRERRGIGGYAVVAARAVDESLLADDVVGHATAPLGRREPATVVYTAATWSAARRHE